MHQFKAFSVLVGLLIVSCNSNVQSTSSPNIKPPTPSAVNCQRPPSQALERHNIKAIQVSETPTAISGMTSQDKQLGYSFEAKSGQVIKYKSSDLICVWIYSPDNRLLDDRTIPIDGKYVIQISAQGASTFQIEVSLASSQSTPEQSVSGPVTKQPSPHMDNSTTPPTAGIREQANPVKFLQEHYANLNSRNYQHTWTDLAPGFKDKIGSFSAYAQWWDTVASNDLQSVKLVSQGGDSAVLDIELSYKMSDGSLRNDPKTRV